MVVPGDALKVLRDSNGNVTNSMESIEILPPRPKRKSIHPYPRKLVMTPRKGISILEQPMRSTSLKSSEFDHENQSPKSVLSAVGSVSLGSSDSDTQNGSLSSMSSIRGVHRTKFSLSEPKTPSEEGGLNDDSALDEKPPVKFGIFPEESVSTKQDTTTEESSGRTLKLFGMTLMVTDACKSSYPTIEGCKPIIPLDIHVHCFNKEDGKLELLGHSTPSETSAIPKLRVRVTPQTCGKGFCAI